MRHSKIYMALLLPLGLSLAGCGSESSSTTTTTTTTPTTITDGSVSLSFPLTFGDYTSADGDDTTIDMFGKVSSGTLASLTLVVDGVEYDTVIDGNTWRASDVSLSSFTDIEMTATKTNGVVSEKEVDLLPRQFSNTIDGNITDIVVNDSNDEIIINTNLLDTSTSPSTFTTTYNYFRLTSSTSQGYINPSAETEFSGLSPTSLAWDTDGKKLFVSYINGVSEVDLDDSSNTQTVLSNASNGSGVESTAILDLAYNSDTNVLYTIDYFDEVINTVDTTSGDRVEILNSLGDVVSIAINSTTNDLYYSVGYSTPDATRIEKYDGTNTSIVYDVAAGDEGGPISDIAINEDGDELFFVDGTGSLIKLDLSDNSVSTVISNLFEIESITGSFTSLIGLHYNAERNVLIAVGKNANAENKLLIIDPVSGDYATVAEGS